MFVDLQTFLQPRRNKWLIILIAAVIIVGGVSSWLMLPHGSSSWNPSSAKVVIVDQLDGSYPNQSFREQVTDLMNMYDLRVDYYGHNEVTVDLFRNLLRNDYQLIILRVHAATGFAAGQPSRLAMFTGEPYSKNKYIWEQINNQVERVRVTPDSDSYFGIYESFVSDEMKGNCTNATVVMMGCDGLTHTKMAEAFIDNGAQAYVGWDGMVNADYVDRAATAFLSYYIEENRSVEPAIDYVMDTIGPDPVFGSEIAAFYNT